MWTVQRRDVLPENDGRPLFQRACDCRLHERRHDCVALCVGEIVAWKEPAVTRLLPGIVDGVAMNTTRAVLPAGAGSVRLASR